MSKRDTISDYMAEIGRKGGKIGGKRRLETMTSAERSEVASKAARARWANRPGDTKDGEVTPGVSPDLVECAVCGRYYRPQWQHARRGVLYPSPHRIYGGLGGWCHGRAVQVKAKK